MSYSEMPIADEIISCECRYYWVPYRDSLFLFQDEFNLPSHQVVHDMLYICFMFQRNFGLRQISIRFFSLDTVAERSWIEGVTDSIDASSSETCRVVHGWNKGGPMEWDIELNDVRFPLKVKMTLTRG